MFYIYDVCARIATACLWSWLLGLRSPPFPPGVPGCWTQGFRPGGVPVCPGCIFSALLFLLAGDWAQQIVNTPDSQTMFTEGKSFSFCKFISKWWIEILPEVFSLTQLMVGWVCSVCHISVEMSSLSIKDIKHLFSVYVCVVVCMEVRGQTTADGFVLLPCRFWGSGSAISPALNWLFILFCFRDKDSC